MTIVELYARLYVHPRIRPILHVGHSILLWLGVRAARRPSERVVEYPWVVSNLGLIRLRVLDIGCGQSRLPLELASIGHEVHGLDISCTDVQHPNFGFVRGDGRHLPYASSVFDAVVAVSTIEHIGLPAYGKRNTDARGDTRVMEEVSRVLKPGGRLLLTVPYGKGSVTPQWRVYDDNQLQRLVARLRISEYSFFAESGHCWAPTTAVDLQLVDSATIVKGVACVRAIKVSDEHAVPKSPMALAG